VEAYQRYAIIEAVVYLVNRDFEALGKLYQRLGFIPPDEKLDPIVMALEKALPDVLDASVGDLNLKNVINSLGDVFFLFPFTLPAYYTSLIRCLGVLEGLALQVDPDVRIVSKAYPFISSRLLTDSSSELQAALQQLLFKEQKPRWDRLEQLLDRAGETGDYDMSQAVENLFDYLISPQGGMVRSQLMSELIKGTDEIGEELETILEHRLLKGQLPQKEDFSSSQLSRLVKLGSAAVSSSQSFGAENILALAKRVSLEPVSRQAGIDVAAAITEKAISRVIRRVFAVRESNDDSKG
jgi:aarF domain-containing kinase